MLINSNNEILLAHNNGTYQFPGGHKEDDEEMDTTLIREVKEETGIDVSLDMGPFMQIVTYDSDYFGTGRKMCSKIYYYVIHTDDVPNYDETNYDELELQTEFNLFYTDVKGLDRFLDDAVSEGMLDPNICKEMQLVIREYNRIYI
jgi:8-oxo-dGTP pyrophosphatase MutT (NUDIX family)